MAKPKDKEVANTATTSKHLPTGKKSRKSLKAGAKKSKKKTSKLKIAAFDKLNRTGEGKEKNGSTQGNEQRDAITKETKAITKATEANPKETESITKETYGGFIFMCNTRTKPDCFRFKVLGLPENKRDYLLRIKPGMKLFLYDFDLKLLYGIFKASSFGGMGLEPAAFNGCYPAQVRFEVEHARAPLPYRVFKDAIKDNLTGTRNMFKTDLSVEQVKELTKLFPPPEQQLAAVSSNAPMMLPGPASATAPARIPAPALPNLARLPAPSPAPAPIRAPAPAPMRTQASFHSHPFENMSTNHTALVQREFAQAPSHAMAQNLALRQNPFGGDAHGPFAQPYAPLFPGSLAPHPAARQFIAPYDMPRVGSFGEGPALYEPMHFARAMDAPAAYNVRNEQRIVNGEYLGPPPVSLRYAFGGPAVAYRRGLP